MIIALPGAAADSAMQPCQEACQSLRCSLFTSNRWALVSNVGLASARARCPKRQCQCPSGSEERYLLWGCNVQTVPQRLHLLTRRCMQCIH